MTRGHRALLLGLAGAFAAGLLLGGLLGASGLPRRAAALLSRALDRGGGAAPLPGQWSTARDGPAGGTGAAVVDEQKARQLLSLGYARGTVPAEGAGGVTVLDSARADPGLRFFCSGHAPEALLMTREGEVLHRWSLPYEQARRTDPERFLPPSEATGCWRRARLLPDGSILAIYEGHGLVKLDRAGRLLWAYPGHCHHDLDLDAEGRIWVLTREAELVPRLHPSEPVLVDYVTVLSPAGEPLRRISVLAALENSPYAPLLPPPPMGGDLLHTNTLEILAGEPAGGLPAFAAGNLLLAIRELDAVAVLDPESERIVWALAGLWRAQHEPTVVEGGRLLVFDNLGRGGLSQVLEIEPATQRVAWRYPAAPGSAGESLHSPTCGAARRLPAGTTLVVESDNGRALEVTAAGETVWEYCNPHRAGARGELIAAILDMYVPAGSSLDWLGRR